MHKGKDKCEFLRNIRKQVAEEYGLRYEPRECHHDGDCQGTCPMCDTELRDLQRQLKERNIEGLNIDFFKFIEAQDNCESSTNSTRGITIHLCNASKWNEEEEGDVDDDNDDITYNQLEKHSKRYRLSLFFRQIVSRFRR
jgi:hypothetical protein